MWSERRLQLALDNASLPVGEHAGWLPRLPALGIGALQLSATHTWADTWHGPRASEAAHTARQLRQAGLRPVQLWVPDTRRPDFAQECRRQSLLASQADAADAALVPLMDAALADVDGWTD